MGLSGVQIPDFGPIFPGFDRTRSSISRVLQRPPASVEDAPQELCLGCRVGSALAECLVRRKARPSFGLELCFPICAGCGQTSTNFGRFRRGLAQIGPKLDTKFVFNERVSCFHMSQMSPQSPSRSGGPPLSLVIRSPAVGHKLSPRIAASRALRSPAAVREDFQTTCEELRRGIGAETDAAEAARAAAVAAAGEAEDSSEALRVVEDRAPAPSAGPCARVRAPLPLGRHSVETVRGQRMACVLGERTTRFCSSALCRLHRCSSKLAPGGSQRQFRRTSLKPTWCASRWQNLPSVVPRGGWRVASQGQERRRSGGQAGLCNTGRGIALA